MKDASADPRQLAILQAAWAAFSTYGFRKTSMDDIARGAGMSRPALYLHYRNKEDISRSLVRHYYAVAVDAVTAALVQPGPLPEVLDRAFSAQGGEIMEVMLTSTHGMEMLDTGTQVAAAEVAAGETALGEAYRSWLLAASAEGRVSLILDAPAMATAITTALKGAKMAAVDYPDYRARLSTLAQVFAAALAPQN